MHVYYRPEYVARATAFATTRKAGLVAELVARRSACQIVSPRLADYQTLRLAHTEAYLSALMSGHPPRLAQSDGFEWDEHTWPSLCASTGGVIAAAHRALLDRRAASLSSGMHHARAGRGAGFCAVNGLAVAALEIADDERLDGPVIVLDLDAHGSGGTQSIVHAHENILIADVVVAAFDPTQPTPRCLRRAVHQADAYLYAVEQALDWCATHKPGLVLYNAGVDPHERNDIGALKGVTTEILARRETMVAEWADAHDLPIAGVLAGGYPNPRLPDEELAGLHMLMIDALAKPRRSQSVPA
jgi:acetoin utilization deacetylase AcuC-like enzyme